MSNQPKTSDEILLDEIKKELTGKISGKKALGFSDAINGVHEDESYFFCDAGAILRVLRGPLQGDEYPAVVELYDLEGNQINKHMKIHEPAVYFSHRYTGEISNGRFFQLTERPSFIAQRNNTFRDEIMSDAKDRDARLAAIGAIYDN